MGSPYSGVVNMTPAFFLLFATAITLGYGQANLDADVEVFEKIAFQLCNTDGDDGLTWDEVYKCEELFSQILDGQGIDVPTKKDFDSADLNQDGILKFEEWEEWINPTLWQLLSLLWL